MTRALVATFMALSIGLLASCVSYDANQRFDPGDGQSGADFMPVAAVVVSKCGQIDCHGSKYRNMRLYGYGSERLNPSDTPATVKQGPDTLAGMTLAEANEDYNAIAALEPTIFQQVIREGGANPERLTFVRKSRGHEMHKGNAPLVVGDPADRCIQSWLQSKTDAALCMSALPPPPDP